MAGTPKRRAEKALIRARLDEVCEMFAAGHTERQIAELLGVSKGSLYRVAQEDAETAAAFARARRAGALVMADETIEIADETERNAFVDPAKSADMRIKARQWYAARLNREELGDSPKVAVQLNVADMHLTALKVPAQAQVIDVEVLPAPQEQPAEPESLDDLL